MKFALAKTNPSFMRIIRLYEFPDRYIVGIPDSPFSLMNGLAGDLSLILDLFDPDDSK
jgi:hypothetical protein